MDKSHVALVDLKLNSDGFDTFQCDNYLMLRIRMESMAKILNCANAKDILVLQATGDDPNVLNLTFTALPNHDKVYSFSV